MLPWLLLLVAGDVLSIIYLPGDGRDKFNEASVFWLVWGSTAIAWLAGGQLWFQSKFKQHSLPVRGLQVLTAAQVAGLALSLCLQLCLRQPLTGNPWVTWFLLLYSVRLLPAAGLSAIGAPLLGLASWRHRPSRLAAGLCTASAWTAGWLFFGNWPDWVSTFLTFGLFVPFWGWAWLVGGLVLALLPSDGTPSSD